MIVDWLYGSIVALRNRLFDREILRARRLQWPVISVGNISVGGAGKTPFVLMLGELLRESGVVIDVLSRGYGRATRGVLQVHPNGSPEQFGDEPLLIASKLRCPVIVGEDRYLAGLQAEERCALNPGNRVHLLDDGFQHRQLHRDLDIVLVSREDLDDKVLPSGRLREPLTALKRADVVVVDKDFPAEHVPSGNFQVWRAERTLDIPELNVPVVAFCGIARPQRFFSGLRNRGIDVRQEIAFRDHHRYTQDDVQKLAAFRDQLHGSRLVTTEKDAMNLGRQLAVLDAVVVPMRMSLLDAHLAIDHILHSIAELGAPGADQ